MIQAGAEITRLIFFSGNGGPKFRKKFKNFQERPQIMRISQIQTQKIFGIELRRK